MCRRCVWNTRQQLWMCVVQLESIKDPNKKKIFKLYDAPFGYGLDAVKAGIFIRVKLNTASFHLIPISISSLNDIYSLNECNQVLNSSHLLVWARYGVDWMLMSRFRVSFLWTHLPDCWLQIRAFEHSKTLWVASAGTVERSVISNRTNRPQLAQAEWKRCWTHTHTHTLLLNERLRHAFHTLSRCVSLLYLHKDAASAPGFSCHA